MMHIVHVLTHSAHGGGQQVAYALLESFRRLPVKPRLTVILPAGGVYVGRFQRLGIDVEEFSTDRLAPHALPRFRSLLRQLQPDVVHSHGKGAGFFVRASSTHHRFRCVHSFHGFHPPARSLPRFLYLTLEDHLLRRTDTVVAVSESERQDVLKNFAIADRRVVAIPNAVDPLSTVAAAQQPLDPEVEHLLGRADGVFLVTMIARDDYQKNYPLAFAAAREVLSRNIGAAFAFVGPGKDDPSLKELQNLYGERVFSTPRMENPLPLIRRSNVVLLTSRKEGCPITLLDAFCLGKPVVATDVPGIRDVVQNGVNGILTGENHKLVAETILQLMSDSTLYNTLSANALQRGREMNVTEWADAYYNVYVRLVGKR